MGPQPPESDPRTEARLSTYRLMEGLQGEAADHALEQLTALRARDLGGWPEVEFLVELGLAMAALIREVEPERTKVSLDALVGRGEALRAPALLAHALALRAIFEVSRSSEAALSDVARAVALLDSAGLPPLDTCTALVVCAAGCNALSLWELVDELYDRALLLVPACEEPLQEAAIAVNRVLVRAEWATALVEQGDYNGAAEQFLRAAKAVEVAGRVPTLPALWQSDVAAGRTALKLLINPPDDPADLLAEARAQQSALRAAGDLEMLPLSECLVALALIRLERYDDALASLAVDTSQSTSSGATSFRLWLRTRALSKLAEDHIQPGSVPGARTSDAISAYDEYVRTLTAQRRAARRALLAAARSRIAGERLQADRDRLSRDIELDPLTGLGNRRTFDAWLGREPSAAAPTAMLLIDLNGFKAVNDEFGHLVGDEVLRRIGRVIADRVRPGDRAIRLGGDEFVVIIEAAPLAGAQTGSRRADALASTAARRAHALLSAVEGQPWDELTPGLRVSASIGIAVRTLEPEDREGAARLYAEADRDLYARKIPAQRGSRPDRLSAHEL